MYRNRNNANLMEELEGREMAVATMNMPRNYRNFYNAQISAIKSELARRFRIQAMTRNEPRRRVRAAKVIQRAFKNMYYRKSIASARGRAASPSTRALISLKAKLANLKKMTNRGAMVNVYNSMGTNWAATGSSLNGATVMNNAQKIMYKAGLI